MQFFFQYLSFLHLTYLFLLFHLFLIKFWFLNTITKSLIISVVHFLINQTLAKAKICYILLIVLSFYFKKFVIMVLKLLYREINIITITILSLISQFIIITTCSYFIRNCIFTKMFITNFSKFFGLLICKQFKSF